MTTEVASPPPAHRASHSPLSKLTTPILIGATAAMLFEQAALPAWNIFTGGHRGLRDAPALMVKRGVSAPGSFQISTNRIEVSSSELATYRSAQADRSLASANPDLKAFSFVTPAAPSVKQIAAAVTEGSSSSKEKAQRLLSWVRGNIANDPTVTNLAYSRYPVETLAEGKGGSQDASYLYLSLCNAAGIEGILINYSNRMSTAVNVPGPDGTTVLFRGKTFTFAEPSAALTGPGGSNVTLGTFPACYESMPGVSYGPHIDAMITGVDASGINWAFMIPAARIQEQRAYAGKRGFFELDDPAQAGFVTPNDPIIQTIAQTLTKGVGTDREKANCLLHFVRSNIRYDFSETKPNTDYFRLPLETMADRLGDCEDKSILFTSLTKAAGIDSALVRLPGHMASAVALKSGDASGIGYHIGEKFYSFVEATGIDSAAAPHRMQRDFETGLAIGNSGNFSTATARIIEIR